MRPIAARADTRERIAGAFVLLVLAATCVAWWIGVPAGVLWALGQATDDGATHFVAGLIGVPLAMAATAPVLLWLNGVYLRVSGALARAQADEEETGWHRRIMHGPLEPILFVSLGIAIVALCVWFFVFAEQPPRVII